MSFLQQRKFAVACAGVLIAGVAAAGPAAAQQAIRLGTSSIGSSFYASAVGMSKLIQEHAKINVTVEPVGGSAANLFGIAAKRVDFAMSNSGATFDAVHGQSIYKKKIPLRLMMQGNATLRWLFVRKGSGIKTPEDLVGKTMATKRRPLPELQQVADAVFKVYHLPVSKIKQVSTNTSGEVARAFRSGSIDAASFPFSPHQPIATKLFADGVIAPLILPPKKFYEVKAQLPDKFSTYEVAANHFRNQPKAFLSLKMTTQVVAVTSTPEEEVYQVTKAVLGHNKEFVQMNPAARPWTVKNTLTEAKIPFHAGAIKYFKEVGKWTPALEKLQEKLLKQ